MDDSSSIERELLKIEPGVPLYETGESSDALYQLSKGCVDLRHNGSTIVEITERDRPLGVAGLELNAPRRHTAVVVEESRIKKFRLDRAGFHQWLDEHPFQLVRIIRNYAHLVDYFNQENQKRFQYYREFRPFTVRVIRPLSRVVSSLTSLPRQQLPEPVEELLDDNPFDPLLSSYRTIVNLTGRSATRSLDKVNVPDETVVKYTADEIVCEEGDDEANFFVLIEGALSVLKGNQRIAVIDKQGSVFGEMSPALQKRRRATVRSDTTSQIATIAFNRLDSILENSPEFSHTLVTIFYKRYRRAVRLNQNLVTYLNHMKTLSRHENLPDDLNAYLREITREISNHDLHDREIRRETSKITDWVNQEGTTFPDKPPAGDLSDFTSRDVSY